MHTPAGWGTQPATPPRHRFRIPRPLLTLLVLFTIALLTGVLARPRGWLALALAWSLVSIALSRGRTIRTVAEWVAVAALALIVAGGAPASPHVNTPQLKAPVKVEAAQTDQLQELRVGVVNLWKQIATGFSNPQPAPKPKKEARR
jgi:hypothetical protein